MTSLIAFRLSGRLSVTCRTPPSSRAVEMVVSPYLSMSPPFVVAS